MDSYNGEMTKDRLLYALMGAATVLPLSIAGNAFSDAPSSLPAQRWENKILILPIDEMDERLERLGKEGWELVSASPQGRTVVAGIKKPN